MGAWTVRLLARKNPAGPGRIDFSRYNWNLHLFFSAALFVVFVSGMIYAFMGTGEFPLLAEKKGDAIDAFFKVNFFASVALSYAGVTMALFFVYAFRPRRKNSWRFWNTGLFMALLSLSIFIFALSRISIAFFFCFAIVFYHYAYRRIPILRLGVVFTLFASYILITGYLKSIDISKTYGLKAFDVFAVAMHIPYMYFANNYWNLDHALNPPEIVEGHPTTYGFTSVSGFLGLLTIPGGNMAAQIREDTRIDDQFHKSSIKSRGWNTISYQWDLYKDFGLVGTLIGPFLIGFILGFLYLRVTQEPTVLNAATYAFLFYFVASSMFSFMLENSIYVYGLLYVIICCYLAQTTHGPRPKITLSP